LSSGSDGWGAGEEETGAGAAETGAAEAEELEDGAGDGVTGGTAVDVAVVVGGAAVGACVDSGGSGFSEVERRRSTGGPSSSFRPRGAEEAGFLAVFAKIEAPLCHVPSAIQLFVV